MDQSTPSDVTQATVVQILRAASKQGASDIHFKAGEPALFRVEGKLHHLNTPELRPQDTQRVFEALRPPHLEKVDSETFQETDFSFAVSGTGRFRVNAFRQRGSIALVVRVIPLSIPDFKELNLPECLPSLVSEPRGLILVTGVTGCGKSTTLAAMLNHINNTKNSHIITIEDPIEFFFQNNSSSIVQREVGSDTGSFAVALRAALRQDPDVIMIGEMRDTETIDIALKAAETGHLVISTAHTTDAAKTVQRILSVFPPSEQTMMRIRLSETLRAVISQRLLPRIDGSGEIPAIELMVVTRTLQECIRDEERTHDISQFIAKGRNYGMRTFDQSILKLLRGGLITYDVAMSAATSPADLDLQLRMGVDEDDEIPIEEHQRQWGHFDGQGPLELDRKKPFAKAPEESEPEEAPDDSPAPAETEEEPA